MSRAYCPRVTARRAIFAALVLSAAAGLGCGSLAPAATAGVTKGAIRGYYGEIDDMDPVLQDRVARKLLDSSAVHDAAHDLLVSAVGGAVDGFTESERTGKVNAFVAATLEAMRKEGDAAMGDLVTRFDKQLAPVLRTLIEDLVSSTSAALREAAARDLPAITSAIVESSLRAFAVAASSASDELRSQAKDFAENDLGPIAGALSQQVAREAIIGVREGIHRDLDLKDPQIRDGMREIGIGLAQGIAQGTPTSPFTTTFAVATFILAGLLLVAIGAVIALYSRARVSAKVIALLAQRLDGHAKAEATVEDLVSNAGPTPR